MDSTNLRITQINLQHCKEASTVLNHRLHKMQTDLALVQEPWIYKKGIKGLNIRSCLLYTSDAADEEDSYYVSNS